MIEVYDRMSEEFEELNTRYLALKDMLDKNQPAFVNDKQWKLLNKQAKVMKKYRKILAKRMDDLYPEYLEELRLISYSPNKVSINTKLSS